jgi:hypothetical protein
MDYGLPRRQVQKLRQKYHPIEGQRFADRIRLVIALSEGFSPSELAKIFLIDAARFVVISVYIRKAVLMDFWTFTIRDVILF